MQVHQAFRFELAPNDRSRSALAVHLVPPASPTTGASLW
jgi:hypothetical protein